MREFFDEAKRRCRAGSARAIACEQGYRSIAFPLIKAGTGGLQPEKVLEIIQDEAGRHGYDGEVRIVRFRRAA